MAIIEGMKVGFDIIWSIITADPRVTLILLLFFGGSVIFAFIVRKIKDYKLRKSRILEVDEMSGVLFEEYLKVLLTARGYYVQLTPASGDYGADLILATKGKKIIVQAKRYKKNVGVKAVQEISTARSYYKADECWVITNSFYTEQGKKLARSNQVKLIDRNQLMSWMLEDNKTA